MRPARPSVSAALEDEWFEVENVSALVAYGEDIVLSLGRFKQMNAMKKVAHQMLATELTEAEIGHLTQQFRMFDRDGDGVITASELVQAIGELGGGGDGDDGGASSLLRGLAAHLEAAGGPDSAAVIDIDEFVAATYKHHALFKELNKDTLSLQKKLKDFGALAGCVLPQVPERHRGERARSSEPPSGCASSAARAR